MNTSQNPSSLSTETSLTCPTDALTPAASSGFCEGVLLTPLGLELDRGISLETWRELGRSIGQAMRSAAFVIGDWLIHAEALDLHLSDLEAITLALGDTMPRPITKKRCSEAYTRGKGDPRNPAAATAPGLPTAALRVEGWIYHEAVRLTGLDVATLQNYAYVARRVPRAVRTAELSWEHHRRVAKIRDRSEQVRWLDIAIAAKRSGEPMTVRRFARCLQAGRPLSVAELEAVRPDDTGIENVHPHVNRIVGFYGRLRATGWLQTATLEKREALRRDLQPILDIYHELQ